MTSNSGRNTSVNKAKNELIRPESALWESRGADERTVDELRKVVDLLGLLEYSVDSWYLNHPPVVVTVELIFADPPG